MMKSHSSEVQVWWHLSGSFEKTLERRRYKLCEFSRWKVFAQQKWWKKYCLPKQAGWIFFLHKLKIGHIDCVSQYDLRKNLSVVRPQQHSGDWFGSTLHIIYIYISWISATHQVSKNLPTCWVFSPNCCRCTTPLPGTFSLGHFPSSIVALWRCGSQWYGPGAHGGISPTGGVLRHWGFVL